MLRQCDPVLSAGDARVDGAVLSEHAFVLRYFAGDADRLLVAHDPDVEQLVEQPGFGAEARVDGVGGHSGAARDGLHRGVGVAALREQLLRRVQDASARLPRLLLAECRVISPALPLDTRHGFILPSN